MKIGIDIDNVISDSAPIYIEKFNSAFQTSVSLEVMKSYWFTQKSTGVEQTKIEDFFTGWLSDIHFQSNLPVVEESLPVIRKWLDRGYILHYVTARPPEAEKGTRFWLLKHHLMNDGSTLDHFNPQKYQTDSQYKKHKADILGINIFIEDSLEIVNALDIPVLLIDKPWNRGKTRRNVRRVKDWGEIALIVEDREWKLEGRA